MNASRQWCNINKLKKISLVNWLVYRQFYFFKLLFLWFFLWFAHGNWIFIFCPKLWFQFVYHLIYFLLVVSYSFPHNNVMYKESKTQEKKRKFPCLLKLRRPVKMQEGTLLKENTKGRNSNFFLNKGWFEFSQFLSQLNDLSFLLHLHVYLGALVC